MTPAISTQNNIKGTKLAIGIDLESTQFFIKYLCKYKPFVLWTSYVELLESKRVQTSEEIDKNLLHQWLNVALALCKYTM